MSKLLTNQDMKPFRAEIYIYIYTYIKVILLIPISTLVSLVTLFNIFIS